jgi:hypothetical protein
MLTIPRISPPCTECQGMDPDCDWCSWEACSNFGCHDPTPTAHQSLCDYHFDHDPENNL